MLALHNQPSYDMSDTETKLDTLFVSIVEDDEETRARLAKSVTSRPELQLIAEYGSGGEALAGLAENAPDVLLVDLGLGDMSGLEVIRFVASHHPHCDVLVISIFGDEGHVLAALEAGAKLKSCA
jgi:DNA-binding NarL/FixJ family response regulator